MSSISLIAVVDGFPGVIAVLKPQIADGDILRRPQIANLRFLFFPTPLLIGNHLLDLHGLLSDGHHEGSRVIRTRFSADEVARAEALVDPINPEDVLHIAKTLIDECERSEVMGSLVQDASPLVFPCAIEYSLICAAIRLHVINSFRTFHTIISIKL